MANVIFAQDQNQQQVPPSVQADTTSGWQLVFSNPRFFIGGFQYFPDNVVYATASVDNGAKLLLMRSYDLGITWDTLPNPIAGAPVYFTSPMIGYAGGRETDKLVWKTIDGGMSWKSYSEGFEATGFFLFPTKDTGLIISSGNYARSIDAGMTWNQLYPPNDISKNDGSFADSKIGYVVGNTTGMLGHPDWKSAGYCQKTTDAGATWTQIYTAIQADFECCQALDVNTLYVGSSESIFAKTNNGGVTWDSITIAGTNAGFHNISFINKKHGLMVGGDVLNHFHFGIIYSTNDSCKTWQQQYLLNPPVFNGVQMLNDSTALISGAGNIYRTTSGGKYSSVAQQHTIDFHVKTYPNPSTGLVSIQYQLPTHQSVSLIFFSVQGDMIGTINMGLQNAGGHQTQFDGSLLASGVYYFRITTSQDYYTGSFNIQK